MSALAAPSARPNGWWGMAVFVAAEATLFGTLMGTYLYLRLHNAHWPPPQVAKPSVLTPALLDRCARLDEHPDAARVASGP